MSHSTIATRQSEHDRYMSLSVLERERQRKTHAFFMGCYQPSTGERQRVSDINAIAAEISKQADIVADAVRESGTTRRERLTAWLKS